MATPGEIPVKAQTSEWFGRSWDWFVTDIWTFLLAGLISAALITVTSGILWGPVAICLVALAAGRERRGKSEIADYFQGLSFFVPSLLSGLLIVGFFLVGLVFLVVPGLVILSMYLFTFHFIYDQDMDFWSAMEASRKLAAGDYFGFAIFALLILVINALGAAFFGFGCILTIPITSLAVSVAYRDCCSTTSAPAPDPVAAPVIID